MKLTFGLLVAAVAVTSTSAVDFSAISTKNKATDAPKSSYCPDACLDYMAPVIDENGVEYSNECYMQAAKCKDKKKSTDPVADAEKLYGRKFFQYSDSNSGSNDAGSDSGSSSAATKIVKGAKGDSSASSDSASGDDTSPGRYTGRSKNCAFACLAVYRPVTDENGNTYSNECQMRAAKCKGDGKPYDPIAEAEKLYGPLFRYSDSGSTEVGSASEESGSSSDAMQIVKGTKAPVEDKESTSAAGDDSASGSDGYTPGGCSFVCPMVYNPVTDENGVTYSNECAMKAAKCKDDGKPRDPLAEAEKLYGRKFFQYSDSNSGSSSASTKMVKGTKAPVKKNFD
ncbi:hypothetical protein PHYBOEH_008826 [Phytophthora boehmeriae]|uniref:Kazal-like domain-containing protein n=1 Tax=Phytophthora boehmeriae TaxID=109152 RepID=A0A8T1X2H5_9STRA|nr:hypothetical protein PHYBOEH_008826 [Phytophthora boehmeriae]